MREAIPWKEAYRTGIPNIDEQHQDLFRIVNGIFAEEDPDRVRLRIMDLYRQLGQHFDDEEAFLKDIDADHLAAHRREHDDMLSELNAYTAGLGEEPVRLSPLRAFLAAWLEEHILEHDRELDLSGYTRKAS